MRGFTANRRVSFAIRKRLTVPYRILTSVRLRRATKRGWAVVSNNCVAGSLYREAGIPYETPTAGLYFIGDAFIEFIECLHRGGFESSRFANIDVRDVTYCEVRGCPVWRIDGVELIAFLHYPNAASAVSSWARRCQRLVGKNLVVLCSIRDGLTEHHVERISIFGYRCAKFGSDLEAAPPADELLLHLRPRYAIMRLLRCA